MILLHLSDEDALHTLSELGKLSGGYDYSGVCSWQICFPLKAGGELRFMVVDDEEGLSIDLYDGALPPGITGPVKRTGQ